MSFLPYGLSSGGWTVPVGSSIVAHGAILSVALAGFGAAPPPPETSALVNYTITLERLDPDVLAGLIEQQGLPEGFVDAPAMPEETLPPPVPEATAIPLEGEARAEDLPEPELPPEEGTEPEDVAEAEDVPEDVAALEEAAEPEVEPAPEEFAEDMAEERSEDLALPEAEEALAEEQAPEPAEPELAETAGEDPASEDDPATPDDLDTPEAELSAGSPEELPSGPAEASEPLVAEIAAPIAPLETASLLAAPQVLEPLLSDPNSPIAGAAPAAPIVAETLTPDRAAMQSLQPLAPVIGVDDPPAQGPLEILGPREADDAARLQGGVERVSAAPPPFTRPFQPPPPPSEQDLAIGDLVARITAVVADPCLIALPRRDGVDGVGLELFATTEAAMGRFSQELLSPEDTQIRQVRSLLDTRQCAVIDYLRANASYPATRLGISLDLPEIASGGMLAGQVRGVAGRYLTLVVVDNNGVVQDLQRFVSFTGAMVRFEVPVTRNATLRDTRHLLLALATDRPPVLLRARMGLLAEDVFVALEGEEATGAAFGLVAFEVQ